MCVCEIVDETPVIETGQIEMLWKPHNQDGRPRTARNI